MRCPICKSEVSEQGPDRPRAFPFCSDRCKLIDLGRWLDGKYQVPVVEADDEDWATAEPVEEPESLTRKPGPTLRRD